MLSRILNRGYKGELKVKLSPRDPDSFKLLRYQPELLCLGHVIKASIENAIDTGKVKGSTCEIRFEMNASSTELTIFAAIRLDRMNSLKDFIKRDIRKKSAPHPIEAAFAGIGFGGEEDGFIQAKLWTGTNDGFMLGTDGKSGFIAHESNVEVNKKINIIGCRLLCSQDIHHKFSAFLAPLRCGALNLVEFDLPQYSLRLDVRDSKCFDCGEHMSIDTLK